MKKFSRGFTLIELLVVIAIIGILSAIVLASLATARGKAQDAKVQGQLSSMRAAAEIYYGNNSNSYGATTNCAAANSLFSDTTGGMAGLISASNTSFGNVACSSTNSAWGVAAPLSSNRFWCVDSTGASKAANNTNFNSGVCY